MAAKKVLLAEDDADDQMLFYDFLHHRTDIFLMPIAENGEEVLQALKAISHEEQLPSFIILDQNMPRLNGLQTLEILKGDIRYTHIPVMVYSTYTDQQLIKDATAMGATKVVAKPITKEGYDEMMNEFVKVFS